MPKPLSHNELVRRKRELRLKIGRGRRQIDHRLHATRGRASDLVNWRTYVARYPLWAMAAALGAGLTVSGGIRPGRMSRGMGLSLLRHATSGIGQHLVSELMRLWSEAGERS